MAKNKKIKKKNKLVAITVALVAVVALVAILAFIFIKNDSPKTGDGEPLNEKFSFLLEEESTIILNDDIFKGQQLIKEDYESKFEKGNFTIEKPYVVANPFLISPQTALIMFETSKEESVTATIKGKHNDDLVIEFEASKKHILPIYGLYGNYENTIIIETESGKKNTIKLKIEEECETGSVNVVKNELSNSNGEFYFGTSSLGASSVAHDAYGEVRWYLKIGYTKGLTMLSNGNILLSSANEGPDITSTSGVVEVDMMGYVHKEYEIEGGYHHDGVELPSGNLIILTSDMSDLYIADHIVELDRKTGKVAKSWNLKDIVDKVDPSLIGKEEISWGWINSVYFDQATDSLILSVRNQNSVVSIGYTSGEINWILGEQKYWSNKFNKYLIKGVGSGFIYPAGQHSVYITEEGKLSIFNNGYNANHEQEVSCKSLRNGKSYAIVYNLDLNNMTASIDWSFGGQEYFSYALSSFTYTSDKHKVFNTGWRFTDEVAYDDPACTQFSNDKYDAYVIEFDENNNIVLEMHILESKFEIVKAPIYNLERESVNSKEIKVVKNYNPSPGSYVSTYEPDTYETLTEEEALEYKNSEISFITFRMYNDRFTLLGFLPEHMEFKVTFISTKGTAYRFTMKEKNQELKPFLNLSAMPRGRYYVYVNLGDFVYNTTEYIELI